jgi:hypothetical protein
VRGATNGVRCSGCMVALDASGGKFDSFNPDKGSNMRTIEKTCVNCGASYEVAYKHRNERKYCSQACFISTIRKQVLLTCAFCSKEFYRSSNNMRSSKSGIYFCSRICKDTASRIQSTGEPILAANFSYDSKSNYRARALAFYGEKCQVCGYDHDVRMLDADHKDSNRSNNVLENLQILCVWCHALKTRKVPYHDR